VTIAVVTTWFQCLAHEERRNHEKYVIFRFYSLSENINGLPMSTVDGLNE
jgi:hypothetical protein